MICQSCGVEKQRDQFPVRNDRSGRLRPYCKDCAKNAQRARYAYHRKANPFKHKATRVKNRASSLGVPYDLDEEYLESIWTGTCPVLKTPISISGDRSDEYTAELDRFDPSKGYTKGNVVFLSRKANRIKNNSDVEILENLLKWMREWKSDT